MRTFSAASAVSTRDQFSDTSDYDNNIKDGNYDDIENWSSMVCML
jgi:hypothetical protein